MRDPLAYLETRRPPKTDTALVSTIISHWKTRHLYGTALVITSNPDRLARHLRKQWLSLLRATQQERTQLNDADKLLALTHRITRMQQMLITAEAPHENPAAHLWCVSPQQLTNIQTPRSCRTFYVATPLSTFQDELIELVPAHSLVVDFGAHTHWDIPPKAALEQHVYDTWTELLAFLESRKISMRQLEMSEATIEPIDDALDTLLESSSAFLRHARQFQEALQLAQPFATSFSVQKQHEIVALLARRVTLLTPGFLHTSLLQTDSDTPSLYDHETQKLNRESLTETIARHVKAGRNNLAQALEVAFVNNRLVV